MSGRDGGDSGEDVMRQRTGTAVLGHAGDKDVMLP
jgi:hypothetical protein